MARLIVASGRNGSEQRVHTELSLRQAVDLLRPVRGNSFAASLVADYDRYRDKITGNKAAWLLVLAQQGLDRAARPEPRPAERLGDFGPIAELFRTAGSRLKYPKVRLEAGDGRPVVLSQAGSNSRYAGQINVSSGHRYGDPDGRFYGRIAQDGSTMVDDPEVLGLLRLFAADPATVAAEYGRRSGSCCFCGLQLTDERSLLVGYGPVCAINYSLSWGDRPTPDRLLLDCLEEKVEYAARERAQEEAGFLSDPDFRADREDAEETVLTLQELLERTGYEQAEGGFRRALAVTNAPWRDDD